MTTVNDRDCVLTIDTDDHYKISEELAAASTKWYRLGLALGLEGYRLDNLEIENPEVIDRFTKMLGIWLKLPEPAWGDLADALDSIGEGRLAWRVRRRYCGMQGPEPPETAVQPQETLQVGQQNVWRMDDSHKVLLVFTIVLGMIVLGMIVLGLLLVLSQYQWLWERVDVNHTHGFQTSHQSQMCGVPHLPTAIIGRDADAERVTKLIDFDNSKVRIVSIVGPPGIGKSTLAKNVGHNLVQNRRVAVYYIDMSGVTNLLSMTEKLMDCQKKVTVQQWARTIDHPTLLVLDNGDGVLQTLWDEFEMTVQMLLEASPYIKVLVTSQKKQLYVHLSPVYEEVRLDVLSTQHACTLLQEMTSSLTPQQAKAIAELTGNMPLALTVIGALIKKLSHNPYTPENIINKLRKEPFSTYSQTRHINASISVSYEYLDDQLKKFIHFLANFPESFDDVSVTEIVNLYNKSSFARSEISEMLQGLLERSLIEYDGERNRYKSHSVIKAYIIGSQGIVENDRVRFSIAFQGYYSQVLVNLSQTFLSDRITTLTSYDLERHNIEHCLYLFDTLEHSNHTIYCRALDSIQLAESKGLIPFIRPLNGPMNSVVRHIMTNDSQTLSQRCMCDSISYLVGLFKWNSNNFEVLTEIILLLSVSASSNTHLQPITAIFQYLLVSWYKFLLSLTYVMATLEHISLSQKCDNMTITVGHAYHIVGNSNKSYQFYQLALTHQHLHVLQQFYVKVRLYEIYTKTNSSEKAETVLHELSQLHPKLESVPASDYIEYKYEMRGIIRFCNLNTQFRADVFTEKEIVAFDQLQVTTGCNVDFSMLSDWKDLIRRKTQQRDFNKAVELGTTVIRVYENQSECKVPGQRYAAHLMLPPIYYYTAIAIYGSNGSMDYLQLTLDTIEKSELSFIYFYHMRLRVCWILNIYGPQNCARDLYLNFIRSYKSIRTILVMVLVLVGFLRYKQWTAVTQCSAYSHFSLIIIVLLIIALDSNYIFPDLLLDIVTLLEMATLPGKSYTFRFSLMLSIPIGLIFLPLKILYRV